MSNRPLRKLPLILAAVLAAIAIWFLLAPKQPRAGSSDRAAATPQGDDPPREIPAEGASPSKPGSPRAAPPPRAAQDTEARPHTQSDGGDPALFGKLITEGQKTVLREALAKNAQSADAYVGRLCDEYRHLQEHPQMPDVSTDGKDAAEYMAPLIDYEAPLNDPPGKLHLSERLKARLQDWPEKMSPEDLAGLDFTWMKEVAQFDHWTLFTAGRLRDYQSDDFYNYPIPNYLSLMQWSKLRYALGFQRGDLAAASTEVRHLADLIRTQGNFIGEAVGIAIYNLDVRARESARAAGRDLSAWPASDPQQLNLQRRMAFSSVYFSYPGVSAETFRKAAGCMASPCPALIEGIGAHRAFGAYAANSNLDALRELAKARGCEAETIKRMGDARELPAGEALDAASEDIGSKIPQTFDAPH